MKVKIDKDLIKHVADISRLNLSEKEINQFSKELKEIIEVFSKLDKVKTDKIKCKNLRILH